MLYALAKLTSLSSYIIAQTNLTTASRVSSRAQSFVQKNNSTFRSWVTTENNNTLIGNLTISKNEYHFITKTSNFQYNSIYQFGQGNLYP